MRGRWRLQPALSPPPPPPLPQTLRALSPVKPARVVANRVGVGWGCACVGGSGLRLTAVGLAAVVALRVARVWTAERHARAAEGLPLHHATAFPRSSLVGLAAVSSRGTALLARRLLRLRAGRREEQHQRGLDHAMRAWAGRRGRGRRVAVGFVRKAGTILLYFSGLGSGFRLRARRMGASSRRPWSSLDVMTAKSHTQFILLLQLFALGASSWQATPWDSWSSSGFSSSGSSSSSPSSSSSSSSGSSWSSNSSWSLPPPRRRRQTLLCVHFLRHSHGGPRPGTLPPCQSDPKVWAGEVVLCTNRTRLGQ